MSESPIAVMLRFCLVKAARIRYNFSDLNKRVFNGPHGPKKGHVCGFSALLSKGGLVVPVFA
jgi:hypothetical protein